VTIRNAAESGLSAGDRRARPELTWPSPLILLRLIDAVLVSVVLALDLHITQCFLGMGSGHAQYWNPVDEQMFLLVGDNHVDITRIIQAVIGHPLPRRSARSVRMDGSGADPVPDSSRAKDSGSSSPGLGAPCLAQVRRSIGACQAL